MRRVKVNHLKNHSHLLTKHPFRPPHISPIRRAAATQRGGSPAMQAVDAGSPPLVIQSRLINPRRVSCSLSANTPLKSFNFPYKHKAYIPVPEEYELVANTTMNEN